ncbi:MAG: tRNA (adenosine(37)-N6)-threonylcarbamoyltransferase complex dimerization subunit type 1 TsaB [Fermentimonas sp.]|nr:tRNA (adenosine(37)-N6)-threonylcarbamoyltransferase complex dimerization subunit type 1 TsaB [Fermentimonas sp.]
MAIILSIETATPICSCALLQNGEVIINRESREGQSHSTLLGVFVFDIMNHIRNSNLKLDAIAISSGPGSYTGLRIGVSEAKGLSYGLGVPMISIPTPNIMASIIKDKVDEETLLCPMIDARRMEVYATFFDKSLNVIRKTSADIVDSNSYMDLLESNKVVFFGNGSEKCKDVLTHPNAIFIEDIHPLASAMGTLAEKAFSEKDFVDSAYFEPFYLKEFVATIPKNKII